MSWWFEKRAPALGAETVALETRMRYNPLRGVDPDVLVAAITEFDAGGLGRLARIVETFERRDDTMRTASRKMYASVARCPHAVLIVEGEEKNPKALEHQKTLRLFWARVRATSAFSRNACGGMRLLKRQMAAANSLGFSVHEIVWRPQRDGTIEATFVHVPLEHFENRTGELRFLRRTSDWEGTPMAGGEWLVATGDGVGIAAAVAAMSKHLSLQDWLLYSERCGQPGIHAKTSAAKGSDAWNALVDGVRNFGREWALVTDPETQVAPISLAAAGTLPYPDLIRRMDQAIAALYRGADLSTISGGSGEVGATLQGAESDILEQDACEMLSETLQEQVDRYVIRYVHGDEEPLAYVQISPVANPNLEREMQVDKHLAGLGVKLSKSEALQRYQRTEATADEDALLPREAGFAGTPAPQGLPMFGNSARDLPEIGKGRGETPPAPPKDLPDLGKDEERLAAAMQRDLRPVGKAIANALRTRDWKALRKRLGTILPECGTESAGVLEAAMKEAGEEAQKGEKDALANARGGNPENRGQFSETEGPYGTKLSAKDREKERKKRKSEAAAKELAKRIAPERLEKAREAKGRDLTENEVIECFKQQNEETGRLNFARVQTGEDCPKFMETRKLGDIGFYQDYDGGGYRHISTKTEKDGITLDPGHQAMLRDDRIAKKLAHGTYYRDIYNGQDAVAVVGDNDNDLVILGHRRGGGLYVITAYVDTNGQRIAAIKKNGQKKGFRLENTKTGGGFPSPELEDVCPGLC